MTSDEFRLSIPQYLANQLTLEERNAFDARMADSPELENEVDDLRWIWNGLRALPEPEASAAVRVRFYRSLSESSRGGIQHSSFAQVLRGWFPKVAFAAVILAFGIYIGHVREAGREQREQLTQMRSQVQELQQMVALSLLDRQSATSRLEGVAWTGRIDRPDSSLMNALIGTLNHDPNVNVRLSSLDALTRFSDEMVVRKALLDAVGSQDSPLVQVALIDELVQIRENNAARQLRSLVTDVAANSVVRQRAQWGLSKLGYQ